MVFGMMVGKEVVGKEFLNRKAELDKIVKLLPRNNLAIYGARRIGKSSLMMEAARRMANRYSCIRIDVRRIVPLDHRNFVKHVGLAVLEAYSDATGEKLLPFFKRLKRELPELLGRLKVDIKNWIELSLAPSLDLTGFLKETFKMGEELGEKARMDFVLMIDELPALVRLTKGRPNPLDLDFLWALRGYMNEAKRVHYMISGSAVGMMERLCGSKESPFYGSLVPIELRGLDRESSLSFLGKFMSKELANQVADETRCFPLYLQAYASAARLDGKSLEELRGGAFGLLYLHFVDLENHLSPQQRLILKTMATGKSCKESETAKALGLPQTTVHANVERMVLNGFLRKVAEGGYEFIDPLFEKWLAESPVSPLNKTSAEKESGGA